MREEFVFLTYFLYICLKSIKNMDRKEKENKLKELEHNINKVESKLTELMILRDGFLKERHDILSV